MLRLVIFLVLHCGSLAYASNQRLQSPLGYSYVLKTNTRSQIDRDLFTYEDLEALIKRKNLRSIEQVLPELKKIHPELFERFVLMYRSKSLQRASFSAPRAILFDSSGRFVLTFNGDSTDAMGFNKLEIIQFRSESHRFEFREISFDSASEPVFSKANPNKCLQCHQSTDRKNVDPRPNWEPYNVWPGSYGSMNGHFKPLSKSEKKKFTSEDQQHVIDQAQESEKILEFLNTVKKSHARYQWLGNQNFFSHSKSFSADLEVIGGFTKDLTDFLGYLNARRILRIMREEFREEWPYLAPVVEGVVRCERMFLPTESMKWHQERLAPEFVVGPGASFAPIQPEDVRRMIYTQDLRRTSNKTPRQISHEVEERLARERIIFSGKPMSISEGLRTLFEPLGVSIADWSMDFQTQGRFAFTERMGVPSHLKELYFKAYEASGFKLEEALCDEVAEVSYEKISEYQKSYLFRKAIERSEALIQLREPLLKRCIACHVKEASYSDTPYIPFDNEALLKPLLNAKPTGRTLLEDIRFRLSDHATLETQMPRGLGRPSREQRQELMRYLEQLAATP